MSAWGDLIGDAVADALNSPPLDVTSGTLEERKHRIWRAICNALALAFEPIWIDLYTNPTMVPCYSSGTTPWPMKTIAWQLTPESEVPVAIWVKNGPTVYEWSLLWPDSGCCGGPSGDPAVIGSNLYTAMVPDPFMRAPVKCMLHVDYDLTSAGWAPLSGVSTWERTTTGTIYGAGVGDLPTVALNPGDRFLQAHTSYSVSYEPNLYGIYEVMSNDGHYAVVRRVLDANTPATLCYGMTVQIQAGSVLYSGKYFQITTADPIVVDTTDLTFASQTTYVPVEGGGDAYDLLTAAQLTTEGALLETLYMTATATDGETQMQGFSTIVGTPGVSEIPAGPCTFHVESVYLNDDPGGITTLKFAIQQHTDEGSELLFIAESPPIHNTTIQDISFQYNIPAAIPFNQSWTLLAIPVLATTSTDPVTLSFAYNSASRGTYINLTFSIAGAVGTTDHRYLTNKNDRVDGVGQHDDTTVDLSGADTFAGNLVGVSTLDGAMTVLDGLSAGGGRPSYGAGTFATGVISVTGRPWTIEVDLPVGADILGIAVGSFVNGDKVTLHVHGTPDGEGAIECTFAHGGSPGAGAAPLRNMSEASAGTDYQDVIVVADPATLEYVYLTSGEDPRWQLTGGPIQ